MKRWYQRQWWYIEKPMPWAMIVLWPFLWVVGTVDELRRRLERPKPDPIHAKPIAGKFVFGGVEFPWNATEEEIRAGLRGAWFDDGLNVTLVASNNSTAAWNVDTVVFPPIVDRDYE